MSCTASSIRSSVSGFGTDASIVSLSSLSDTEQKCYNENDNIWIETDKSVDINQQIKVFFVVKIVNKHYYLQKIYDAISVQDKQIVEAKTAIDCCVKNAKCGGDEEVSSIALDCIELNIADVSESCTSVGARTSIGIATRIAMFESDADEWT
jgi:hypothetical protein